MKNLYLKNINKFLSIIFLALFSLLLIPSSTHAIGNPFVGNTDTMGTGLTPLIGGNSLVTASQSIATFTDISGAYYDSTLKRIVFIGRTDGAGPTYNKDDMAVAIQSIFFGGVLPTVDIGDDPNNPGGSTALVTYTGPIQNTNLGNTLFNADYKLKQYVIGYDSNNAQITSTVPTYKSAVERYALLNPNPVLGNQTKFILSPQGVSIKNNSTEKAFVFNSLSMQAGIQHMNPSNDPQWNQAASAFASDITTNYDQYAQESSSLAQAKQIAKIVAILKWISDNNISTDLYWAQNYTPNTASTPSTVQKVTTPTFPNGYSAQGEINFNTPNSYVPDDGTAAGIKSASQAVSSSGEDTTWTFTNGGQQYQAVAVSANTFDSLGGFSTSVIDFASPIAGDLTIHFTRSYSSFNNGQSDIGLGWGMLPGKIYPNSTLQELDLVICGSDIYFNKLAIDTPFGHETFTFNCPGGYSADDPSFHSKLVQNSDDTFTATLSDQIKYKFNADFQLTSIVDKNNNTINYSYDSSGRLISIADTNSHNLTIAYNPQSLVSSVTDWTNRKVEYSYDTGGRLTSVKDPKGEFTYYGYDTNNRLTTVTDRTGQVILTNTFSFDSKINTQKDAANLVKTNTYDKAAKIISQTDSLGRVVTTKYDAKARILEQKDPDNKSNIYTYGAEAVPLTQKDKNGHTTTFTYDSSGNVTSVTFPDTAVITYTYNTENRVTRITDGRYSPAKETSYTYTNGNLTQKNESGRNYNFTYNTAGEVLTLTDPLNHTRTWTYNTLGNALTEKDANNQTATFTYDTLGRLTQNKDANYKTVNYTYDNNGNLLTKNDSSGTTTFVYDKENRLTKTTLSDNAITEYAYNPSGSITTVKNALNNTTTYGYDFYQNLTSTMNALGKTTTNTYDTLNRQKEHSTHLGKTTKWEFDANGNITKRIDANNNSSLYQYDNLNRLKKIIYPNSSTVTYQYDYRGNLTSMIDQHGTSTFIFDKYDRMTKSTDPNNRSLEYVYDNADNITQIKYPDNKLVQYTYDNNNRMLTIKDWNNKTTTYTYNSNGTLATRTYPNNLVTYYTYDNANRITTLEHKVGSTSKAKFALARSSVGNIIYATQSGSLVSAQTNPYTYDKLGQLTNATLYDPNEDKYKYVYDAVGNIITYNNDSISDKNNVYDADDKLITFENETQTYDNNGNLTRKFTNQTDNLSYDYENRLINHNGNTYKYDGLGNRIFASNPNFQYINDINSPLARTMADYDLNFNKYRYYYIYGVGSAPIAHYVNTSGSTYSARYYVEDALGNTRWLTDSSANTSSTMRYDPFGNYKYTQYLPPTYNFSGQKYDSESDLTYMRARYFDPEMMRFISKDPNPGKLSNPLTQNPYAYAHNNPANFSDPSGECIWDVCAAEAMLVSAALTATAPVWIAAGDSIAQDIRKGDYISAADTGLMFVPGLSVQKTAASLIGKSFLTKAGAKAFIARLGLSDAARLAANKAIRRATSASVVRISHGKDGKLYISIYREGRNGFQVMQSQVDANGLKSVVQKAYDDIGNLVHDDPKFP